MPRTCDVETKVKALRDFVQRERRMPGYREMLRLVRYRSKNAVFGLLRRLAAGETLCVNDFAGITRRNQDAASRHLVILLRAGAVVPVPAPDGDGRKQAVQELGQLVS